MVNNLIFDGVVREKTPTRMYLDEAGRRHQECTILVETDDEYPQQLAVRLADEEEPNAPELGEAVRCYLYLRAHKAVNGIWYNEIIAYGIVKESYGLTKVKET